MEKELFVTIIYITVYVIVLFLIIRELVCWYFKINEHLLAMKTNNKLLKEIKDELFYLMPEEYKSEYNGKKLKTNETDYTSIKNKSLAMQMKKQDEIYESLKKEK